MEESTRPSLGKSVGMLPKNRFDLPPDVSDHSWYHVCKSGANVAKQLQNYSDAAVAPFTSWGDGVQCLWSLYEGPKPVSASESKA